MYALKKIKPEFCAGNDESFGSISNHRKTKILIR